ncbi:FtsX-like permease family protein [uncultured Campylobacter sp.]|uniref:ABC transporter permease n=1 Tax=uncultured Campylobacter sp. TaxID=218934 RepID=UPI00262F2E14|nr:FtsX-like permease family protein [uncultured Campylobacter sp.]
MIENNDSFLRRIILKSIVNGGVQSLIIFISVLIGAMVCCAFVNVYADIDAKVSKELNSYGANTIITPSANKEYIEIKDLEKLSLEIPNLIAINPYLFATVSIGVTDSVMMGLNFSQLHETMPYLDLSKGEFINVDFDDRNGLIGVDLAKIAGVKVGDEIEVSIKGHQEVHKIKIKGIVYDGDKEDNMLIVSLELAEKILKKEGLANYAQAVINDNYDNIVKLSKRLNNSNYELSPISKVSKQQGVILDKIKLLMALISIIVLIITSVCVNTSLSSILLSRIKQLALLRAIGASKKEIVAMLLKEITLLSLLGAMGGIVFGFLLAQLLGRVIFDSSIDFRVISAIVATIVALICAFLASYLPIKKALKQNLANLLRGE